MMELSAGARRIAFEVFQEGCEHFKGNDKYIVCASPQRFHSYCDDDCKLFYETLKGAGVDVCKVMVENER